MCSLFMKNGTRKRREVERKNTNPHSFMIRQSVGLIGILQVLIQLRIQQTNELSF